MGQSFRAFALDGGAFAPEAGRRAFAPGRNSQAARGGAFGSAAGSSGSGSRPCMLLGEQQLVGLGVEVGRQHAKRFRPAR
jgi:hypothetical protein